MKDRRFARIAAAAVVLALLGSATPTMAGEGEMKLWWVQQPTARPTNVGCFASVNVRAVEYGTSGIMQLKAKYSLRSPNDIGLFLPTYAKRAWYYSPEFPDDEKNYMFDFYTNFTFPQGHEYSIAIKARGVRPGFWNPDEKVSMLLEPIVACSLDLDGTT